MSLGDIGKVEPGVGVQPAVRDLLEGLLGTIRNDISDSIMTATVELAGVNPTRVRFTDDAVAEVTGTNTEPFDLSGDAKVLTLTPDGEAEETITFDDDTAFEDISAATAQEIVDYINEEATNFAAEVVDGEKVKLLGLVAGLDGSLVIADPSHDLNTIIGISDGTYKGAQGMGYDGSAGDTDYTVQITHSQTVAATTELGVTSKNVDEFEIECETAGTDTDVDVLVIV